MKNDVPKGQRATPTADQFAESLRPIVEAARERGITSRHALADYLTSQGVRTPRGKPIWDHDGAGRLLARLRAIDARLGAE